MKKIVTLIVFTALLLTALYSCGKAEIPAFIPIEDGATVHLYWGSGASKNIDTEERAALVVEAYNSAAETKEYEEGGKAEWLLVIVCESGEGDTTVYTVSSLGDDRFNVSISGAAAPEGEDVKYLVVNEALSKVAVDELLNDRPINVSVHVKIALSAGTPDADGVIREEEEVILESDQTLSGSEANIPTAYSAVVQALMLDGNVDYELYENTSRISSIAGFKEDVTGSDGSVENLHWQLSVNGEVIPTGEALQKTAVDGDEIALTYVLDVIGSEN